MNFLSENINSKFYEMLNFKKGKGELKKNNFSFNKNKILKKDVFEFLNNNFKKVTVQKSYFDSNYKNDIYNKIYGSDFFYNEISEIRAKKKNNKKILKFLKERILFVKVEK